MDDKYGKKKRKTISMTATYCAVNTKGINRKKKNPLVYPNLESQLVQYYTAMKFLFQCLKAGTSAKFSPRQQQVQNFPQLVIKFILKNIRAAGLEIPWLRVRISAGRALKERQCTLKGQAWYVNVRGSVHWKGVY